jgi:capsid protein
LKEAKAVRERIDVGLTTLSEETVAYDGGDWESKHRQRAREASERVEDGLQAPVTALISPPPLVEDEYDEDKEEA